MYSFNSFLLLGLKVIAVSIIPCQSIAETRLGDFDEVWFKLPPLKLHSYGSPATLKFSNMHQIAR
jgi:hypothetical protein